MLPYMAAPWILWDNLMLIGLDETWLGNPVAIPASKHGRVHRDDPVAQQIKAFLGMLSHEHWNRGIYRQYGYQLVYNGYVMAI